MIKKVKVEIVEEKGKKTFKDAVEIKQGALAQEQMKELKAELFSVLSKYNLTKNSEEGEE